MQLNLISYLSCSCMCSRLTWIIIRPCHLSQSTELAGTTNLIKLISNWMLEISSEKKPIISGTEGISIRDTITIPQFLGKEIFSKDGHRRKLKLCSYCSDKIKRHSLIRLRNRKRWNVRCNLHTLSLFLALSGQYISRLRGIIRFIKEKGKNVLFTTTSLIITS